MSTEPGVIDVDQADFPTAVVARSRELPVVVDFWAPWCGPCRFLGPILEGLVEGEFKGQLVLAKVNTDENPDLSLEYGIRGIPAVKVFRGGQVVAEFVGALPEDEVRRVFRSVLPSDADRLAEEGLALEQAGDGEGAERSYRAALEQDRMQPRALLGLGRLQEARGDLEAALDSYFRVPGGSGEVAEATRRAALVRLRLEARSLPDRATVEARLARDPKDVEARHGIAIHRALAGEHRAALEDLLAVVRADRKFRDDGARRAMLLVFEAIGTRSELADEFRGRLANALY